MNADKLTLSQLEQYLSKAAWILKGPVDASDFKVYIVEYLKRFTEAPTLSQEEVDFDVTNADSFSLKRMVSKKRGSWFQISKDMEPSKH